MQESESPGFNPKCVIKCLGKEKANRQVDELGHSYLRKCKIKDAVCQNEKNKQKENQEKIIKSPSPDRRLVHPAEVKHG